MNIGRIDTAIILLLEDEDLSVRQAAPKAQVSNSTLSIEVQKFNIPKHVTHFCSKFPHYNPTYVTKSLKKRQKPKKTVGLKNLSAIQRRKDTLSYFEVTEFSDFDSTEMKELLAHNGIENVKKYPEVVNPNADVDQFINYENSEKEDDY